MINCVILAGNTTRDIELRQTGSGMPVASFGIAVNDRVKNTHTGEYEDRANFFDVTAFGTRWEKLARYIPKGTKICIQGKLRWSQWEKDGQKRSKVEVIADEVEIMTTSKGESKPQSKSVSEYETYGASASVYDDDIPF